MWAWCQLGGGCGVSSGLKEEREGSESEDLSSDFFY